MSNGPEKSSTPTPASPSSHPPPSATVATNPEFDYSHNNIMYIANPASPTAAPLIQFPSDIHFSVHELALPADQLFRLLRRQLHWAQQDAEELKAEAELLEKKRKEEWVAKELLLENAMEAELARMRRKRSEMGVGDEVELWDYLEEDVKPARALEIKAKTMPWWREDLGVSGERQARDGVPKEPNKAVPEVQNMDAEGL